MVSALFRSCSDRTWAGVRVVFSSALLFLEENPRTRRPIGPASNASHCGYTTCSASQSTSHSGMLHIRFRGPSSANAPPPSRPLAPLPYRVDLCWARRQKAGEEHEAANSSSSLDGSDIVPGQSSWASIIPPGTNTVSGLHRPRLLDSGGWTGGGGRGGWADGASARLEDRRLQPWKPSRSPPFILNPANVAAATGYLPR
jgi:hypothetical protein